jgi:Fe-S cluster assembly iron-binding protein IscA
MGDTMIEITKSAIEKISEYFKDNEVKPVRILIHGGGCAMPSLALDVGEPKDTDNVFDIDGFQFVINRYLLKEAEPIKVDYNKYGFQFDSSLEFEGGCSACNSDNCG